MTKIDYTKECWCCGKDTLVSQGDYYKCSSCWATWNEQPEQGMFTDIAGDRRGQGETPSYHPVQKRTLVKAKGPPRKRFPRG